MTNGLFAHALRAAAIYGVVHGASCLVTGRPARGIVSIVLGAAGIVVVALTVREDAT